MSTTNSVQLVSGERLLELLFDENSRPSVRWLRQQQKRRALPYIKVGHLVRFDVDRVREALAKKFTVEATHDH